jgi:anaerobic dimethyl sulfoxide reductase subunit B
MAKQMAFYFNQSACNGCKACVIACKSKNDLPVGVNYRRVVQYGGGGWVPDPSYPSTLIPSNMFAYATSVACNHCESAVCVDICPAKAYSKGPDGIVNLDNSKCIGCRYCEWACPYGAPQFDERKGVISKCDFCADELAKGGEPYCVAACVMRALDYGELDELRQKYGNHPAVEPLAPQNVTRPALVITPHRHAQPAGKGTGRIIDFEEV